MENTVKELTPGLKGQLSNIATTVAIGQSFVPHAVSTEDKNIDAKQMHHLVKRGYLEFVGMVQLPAVATKTNKETGEQTKEEVVREYKAYSLTEAGYNASLA